jgi:hypothetical protein
MTAHFAGQTFALAPVIFLTLTPTMLPTIAVKQAAASRIVVIRIRVILAAVVEQAPVVAVVVAAAVAALLLATVLLLTITTAKKAFGIISAAYVNGNSQHC